MTDAITKAAGNAVLPNVLFNSSQPAEIGRRGEGGILLNLLHLLMKAVGA